MSTCTRKHNWTTTHCVDTYIMDEFDTNIMHTNDFSDTSDCGPLYPLNAMLEV